MLQFWSPLLEFFLSVDFGEVTVVSYKSLAAQFNGNEKRQSSPSPSSDRRRQLRAPGGGFKPIKHGSPEFCGILGERVDPTVPLEKQM